MTKKSHFLVFYVHTACGQKIRKSLVVNLTPQKAHIPYK